MKLRFPSLLAVLVFSLLLAGCGDKTDKDDKTGGTQGTPPPGGAGGGGSAAGETDDPAGGDPVAVISDAASRTKSLNNLQMIAMAMHLFMDNYQSFPPPANLDAEGKPLLSWRVHMLPYLEENDLYSQFHLDEPWDSEHNKPLIAKMPKIYQVPGVTGLDEGQTLYVVPTGTNTMFPPSSKMGADSMGGGVGINRILDGTSNTLLVAEASKDKAVIWTKPDDLPFDPAKPREGLKGLRPGGFLGVRADASTLLVPAKIDDTNLKRLIIRDDAELLEIPE